MRLTNQQLRKIIKEELQNILNENLFNRQPQEVVKKWNEWLGRDGYDFEEMGSKFLPRNQWSGAAAEAAKDSSPFEWYNKNVLRPLLYATWFHQLNDSEKEKLGATSKTFSKRVYNDWKEQGVEMGEEVQDDVVSIANAAQQAFKGDHGDLDQMFKGMMDPRQFKRLSQYLNVLRQAASGDTDNILYDQARGVESALRNIRHMTYGAAHAPEGTGGETQQEIPMQERKRRRRRSRK